MELMILVLAVVAGIIVLVGTLVLLFKERIYIDSQTRKITKIELPLGLKLESYSPVLVMLFFGLAMVIIPVVKIRLGTKMVKIHGHINPAGAVSQVYAVTHQIQPDSEGQVDLEVPETETNYEVFGIAALSPLPSKLDTIDLSKHRERPVHANKEWHTAVAGAPPTKETLNSESSQVRDKYH